MGKRGPAAKPAAIAKLNGNPGKHGKSVDTVEFEALEAVPEPFAWLGSIAKKEWRRLAPLLHDTKLLSAADLTAFGAYCSSYELWVQAERQLQATKDSSAAAMRMCVEDDKGNVKASPLVGIAADAKKQMLQFAREFGLTPSARSNVSAPQKDEGTNSIMEFIKGG